MSEIAAGVPAQPAASTPNASSIASAALEDNNRWVKRDMTIFLPQNLQIISLGSVRGGAGGRPRETGFAWARRRARRTEQHAARIGAERVGSAVHGTGRGAHVFGERINAR